MPIDYNILLQNRGTQSDPGAAMERGMRMGDMLKQRKEEQAIKDAYKAGVVQNPDGTSTVDRKKTIASLMQTNPQEAFKAEQAFRAQDLESMKQKHAEIDMIGQLAGSATNQETYGLAIAKAKQMGLDVSGLPPQFDPRTVQGIAMSTMNAKERLEMEMRKQELEESRKERRWLRGQSIQERADAKDEANVQKLSKDVAGVQDSVGAIDEVERELGGKLEEFTKGEDGSLLKGGAAVDLPGVSIPGIGRITALSSKARGLNSAAATVFNSVLKDRSGAAVTDNELNRIKQEFSQGKYNTESEMIDALQRYKRRVAVVMKNREAGYNPRVVSKYSEQGGRTSGSLGAQGTAGNYDNMSDSELAALYQQRMKGAKNAKP